MSADSVSFTESKMPNGQGIIDPLSLNLYTYCYGNPVRYTDPTGNVPVETVLDIASIAWSAEELWNDPSWANLGFLAWDIAATAIPYAPGSYVAKAGRLAGKTDDVVAAANAMNKVDKIAHVRDGKVIMSYSQLRKVTAGTGLEAHHLFEKRFAGKLGLNANDILSIAIEKKTHQQITNKMREKILYNTRYKMKGKIYTSTATPQEIWDATRETYKELKMTQYLDLLKQSLIDSGAAKKITDWGKW